MRSYNLLVFDDLISGTVTTWYTGDEFVDRLGSTDSFAVGAVVTNLGGLPLTLTVQGEHSCDEQGWMATPLAEVPGVSVPTSGGLYWGSWGAFSLMVLAKLRFRITLGGTNPSCRLKLFVTGRDVFAGGNPQRPA
jgi:hypothetical protein